MTEKRLKFTWALLILVLLQIIMMLVLRFAADATGNFLKAANLADYITNIVGVFLGGYLFALWSEKKYPQQMVLQHKKLAWGSTILLLVLNLILVTKLWQEILPQALQGDRKALAAIGALIFLVALFTLLNYLLTRWALARGSSIVKRYVEQVALRKSKM